MRLLDHLDAMGMAAGTRELVVEVFDVSALSLAAEITERVPLAAPPLQTAFVALWMDGREAWTAQGFDAKTRMAGLLGQPLAALLSRAPG